MNTLNYTKKIEVSAETRMNKKIYGRDLHPGHRFLKEVEIERGRAKKVKMSRAKIFTFLGSPERVALGN